MNSYAEYMKSTSVRNGRAALWSEAVSAFSSMAQACARHWLVGGNRNAMRNLDRLDDRLLNDIGLRRERFPSGTTLVVRL